MGAAFLCGHCGILRKTEDNAMAYLQHWLEELKADPSLLVRAGSQAQKAYDYLTGTQPQPYPTPNTQPSFAGAAST
jgi:antirestriction protein ArdC